MDDDGTLVCLQFEKQIWFDRVPDQRNNNGKELLTETVCYAKMQLIYRDRDLVVDVTHKWNGDFLLHKKNKQYDKEACRFKSFKLKLNRNVVGIDQARLKRIVGDLFIKFAKRRSVRSIKPTVFTKGAARLHKLFKVVK